MSAEERLIAEQWASGNAWDEIGAKVGARPDALRIRLGRAFDRVRRELTAFLNKLNVVDTTIMKVTHHFADMPAESA